MAPAERTLIVIRHAKSAWPLGVADVDRPLNERGQRDAPAVGRWLVARDLVPEHAYVSPARRTQATWGLIRSELPVDVPADAVDAIYAAQWQTLLDVVRSAGDDLRSVALVGHNPGCEDLVGQLAGSGSDAAALAQVELKYPTAATAVLAFDGAWADVAEGEGRLVDFAAPRG